jgi:O-antigen/teichoic acid export membrane protein
MTLAAAEPLPRRRRPLISIPFLLLRGVSTAGLMAAALIQIYVFARVMDAEQFSIFILVGTVGYSLWLCDLGAVKFLFVSLRAAHLSGRRDAELAKQALAVVLLYVAVALAGALLCFLAFASLPSITALDAGKYALFFLFTALNLAWYALRNVSIAIDDYVRFESIEAGRRFASIGVMLAMLGGLSIGAFLIAVNLLWALCFWLAIARLRYKRILLADFSGTPSHLYRFYRGNRRELLRSGVSATGEFYVEHLPYLIVPLMFGLGAPTVILDTTFKFVRGANLYYHAICELVVPRQTSALAERDAPTLVRATLLALLLATIPTLIVSAGLIVAAETFFRLLLGPVATMPAEVSWAIIALLFATQAQVMAHSLLIHAGYFKEAAHVMSFTALAATVLPMLAFLGGGTIVEYLGLYAAAFASGAALNVLFAIKGPMRAAYTA